jgi:steroid delta-isomerase-like uncharacterized protein
MTQDPAAILASYYAAFNRQDVEGMCALLADNILHEPSQGQGRHGLEAFRAFLAHMNRCYAEQVIDPVFMVSADGARASAEFMLDGRYLVSDEGLPPASGQTYSLRVGAFFELADGKITRISNHYNLADWVAQVEGSAKA